MRSLNVLSDHCNVENSCVSCCKIYSFPLVSISRCDTTDRLQRHTSNLDNATESSKIPILPFASECLSKVKLVIQKLGNWDCLTRCFWKRFVSQQKTSKRKMKLDLPHFGKHLVLWSIFFQMERPTTEIEPDLFREFISSEAYKSTGLDAQKQLWGNFVSSFCNKEFLARSKFSRHEGNHCSYYHHIFCLGAQFDYLSIWK